MSVIQLQHAPALDVDPAPDLGQEELAWIDAHGDELVSQHAGKWIAVQGSALVAVADDLTTVLKIARARGVPHPLVLQFPLEPILNLVAPVVRAPVTI